MVGYIQVYVDLKTLAKILAKRDSILTGYNHAYPDSMFIISIPLRLITKIDTVSLASYGDYEIEFLNPGVYSPEIPSDPIKDEEV